MKKSVCYVGLDVHKSTITMALAKGARQPAEEWGTIPNDLALLIKRLGQMAPIQQLAVCYESGPTGNYLARELNARGICCWVVAPAQVPFRRGDRVKTDRRDARRLAHFLRSGDLIPVAVMEEQVEAMRDLVRTRADAKRAETAARCLLNSFLLRHGRQWSGPTKWTTKHWTWIRQQTFVYVAQTIAYRDYVTALENATERLKALEKAIEEQLVTWPLRSLVKNLMSLRGVALITAVSLAAEIGDYRRFASARQFMSYLGLVPSEHSSGQSRHQGSITRMGNREVRRLLVESAWNYRFAASKSYAIQKRSGESSAEAKSLAWKAQQRLCGRYRRLYQKGKPGPVVATSIARELAGFIWAMGQMESSRPIKAD